MIQIGASRAQETPEAPDAVALLLACHQRIRRFCAVARKIAEAEGLDRASVEATRRYFVEALPLHAADEETLFLPRVGPLPDGVEGVLRAQHQEIEARLLQMARRWDRLLAGERVVDLLQSTERWVALLEGHLDLEEASFIPAARAALSEAEHRAFVEAMQARRVGA